MRARSNRPSRGAKAGGEVRNPAVRKMSGEGGECCITNAPPDRRLRLLSLTPAGHAALRKALPIWIELHGAIEADLPDPSRLRAEFSLLSE